MLRFDSLLHSPCRRHAQFSYWATHAQFPENILLRTSRPSCEYPLCTLRAGFPTIGTRFHRFFQALEATFADFSRHWNPVFLPRSIRFPPTRRGRSRALPFRGCGILPRCGWGEPSPVSRFPPPFSSLWALWLSPSRLPSRVSAPPRELSFPLLCSLYALCGHPFLHFVSRRPRGVRKNSTFIVAFFV